MNMQMRDCFATLWAIVDDYSEAIWAVLLTQLPCRVDEVSEQRFVLGRGLGHTCDERLGNDEQVDGRTWVDVTNANTVLIFVNFFRWDVAIDNFLKECLFGHDTMLPDGTA